jgi:2,3,4,5-tetrahydropyridine-2-carboxylate N-succinyltransferase
LQELISKIETAYAVGEDFTNNELIHKLFAEFKQLLNSGKIRAAEKIDDKWWVNDWVKKGVLLGFKIGRLREYGINDQFRYFDKDTYPLKKFNAEDAIRQVPGGSSIRDATYVAKGVVIMPPAYINVGAYVDESTMVDSHALVGSCAQIGKRVHLSAGCQIGGVLEPIGAMPVIIEDDVMVGGNSGIYDGTIVESGAVIGAGTVITGSTPVYDLVNETVYKKSSDAPLIIPAGAVVVAGTRPGKGRFAEKNGISLYTPLIIKYRDSKTDAATALEDALR